MWPTIEKLEIMFEAYCRADTSAMIKAIEGLNEVVQVDQRSSNNRSIAILKILTGDFKGGKDILDQFVFGGMQSTSGFRTPWLLYFMGVANEGLGNTEEAIKNYEEVLSYWGNPEIEIREIKDLKKRLAKLTS